MGVLEDTNTSEPIAKDVAAEENESDTFFAFVALCSGDADIATGLDVIDEKTFNSLLAQVVADADAVKDS